MVDCGDSGGGGGGSGYGDGGGSSGEDCCIAVVEWSAGPGYATHTM
jgi:hypothetical protein